MSLSRPPPDRVEQRIKTEARAALTCLMPRTDDDLKYSITRIVVAGWFIWALGIASGHLTQGDVVAFGFTFFQLTGLIVLYSYGRLHDLEFKQILGFGSSSRDQLEHRERETDRRERGQRREHDHGEFRYGDDRRDDDQ